MELAPFEQWAIVEIFGHTRLAGLVTEATIGGCSFVRVDVPEHDGRPGFTRFYGNGAIYSMTIVDREVCMAALSQLQPRPITNVYLPQLTAPVYDSRSSIEEEDADDDGIPFDERDE